MDHPAIKWGTISGLCNIIFMLVLYVIDPENLFGILPLFGLIIHLTCMVIAGLEYRSQEGGVLSWINGTKITLLTYAIASLLFVCFYNVLYNFVDPGLAELQEEVSYETLESVSKWMTEEQMDEAIAALEEEGFDITLYKSAMIYLIGLVLPGAVFAATIGLFIKKEPEPMV